MRLLSTFTLASMAMLCVGLVPVGAATLRMVIQSHADMGAKCLDIPYAQFASGMRLQTWDCNNGRAQIFSYDDQTLELKIGNLCVTSWGRGDPQDAVGIDRCLGGPNQHWRMVEVKDYYQVIGINNRCLEVRYGVNSNGAPLDVMDCDANRAQRLWALVEAPPAPAEAAACHTDDFFFSVPNSQSATTKSVSTGGSACIYSLHPGPQVQWTSVSIAEQPQNGTMDKQQPRNGTIEQALGGWSFRYQPNPGFHGQDKIAIKICGHNADRSGCATLSYRITVN